jgi:alpha-tubulin suppressor-like RCC1 family protein
MRRGKARPRLAVLAALTLLAAICPALQVALPASASVASPRVTGRPGHAAMPAGAVLASSHATLIAAGNAHSCMIQSGQAYCWGSNSNGQLGDGSISSTTSPVPVYSGGVLAGRTLTQIVAGGSSTCALDSTGVAYCWGLNSSGQLGNNGTTQSLVPVAVSTSGVLAGKTLVQLAAGNAHVCALDSTGTAYCWGSNGNGQLGNNSTTKSLVPVAVTTSGVLSGVTLAQISADQGGQYTCALSTAGAAYCWGAASFGQLGNGGSSTQGVPVAVSTSGVLAG